MKFIPTLVVLILYLCLSAHGGTWTPALANWDVGDGNDSCIILVGYFTFLVPYQLLDGQDGDAIVQIPKDASAEGSCEAGVQQITLEWDSPEVPENIIENNTSSSSSVTQKSRNRVTFTFEQRGVSSDPVIMSYYELTNVKAVIHSDPIQFRDASHPDKAYELEASGMHTWSAPLDMSYFCRTHASIALNAGILETGGIHAQAFHKGPIGKNNMDFGPRSYCAADVNQTITTGFLFMGLLFLISLGIAIFITRKRRWTYDIL